MNSMQEKYFFIEAEKARELLSRVNDMKTSKRGIDSRVYLTCEYAILKTERIKLRNVTTRDDDLAYFDELINTLMELQKQGAAVVPILGYCFDPDSDNGTGYIIQSRAKGEELYDDAIMNEYYVWARENPEKAYFSSDACAEEYILSRTNFIADVPQNHFDKFINDIIVLFDNDILIDFGGKSNFFYDGTVGFQFIDLNSHTDYKYGLDEHKPDSRELASICGFAPCHFAVGTLAFRNIALDEKSIAKIGDKGLRQLAQDNRAIFEKCKTAILNNGISEKQLNKSLEMIKVFGCF